MASNSDPYQVIGVAKTASAEEIKKAYRDLVKKYHPDNYLDPTMKKRAESRMAEINQAYDILSDPSKRTKFDQQSRYTQYNPYGSPFGQNPYQQGGGYQNPFQNPYQNRYTNSNNNPYGNMYGGRSGMSCCDGMVALCCADTLCECMGGDLCPGC